MIMSVNLMQSLLANNVAKKPTSTLGKAGKTPQAKPGWNFMQLLEGMTTKQTSKGSLPGSKGQTKLKGKVTNLYLKLKKLAKELSDNPKMTDSEKKELVARLDLQSEIEELKKLPADQSGELLQWLKQSLGESAQLPLPEVEVSAEVQQEIMVLMQGEIGKPENKVMSPQLNSGGDSLQKPQAPRVRQKADVPPKVLDQPTKADQAVLRTMAELIGAEPKVKNALLPPEKSPPKVQKKNVSSVKQKNIAAKAEQVKTNATNEIQNQGPETTQPAETVDDFPVTSNKLLLQKKAVIEVKQPLPFVIQKELKHDSGSAELKGETTSKQPQVRSLTFELSESVETAKKAVAAKQSARNQDVADPYKVVDQVLQKVKIQLQPGISKVEMQLEPKHLGKVRVQLVMENNQLNAKLTTGSVAVQDILQQSLSQLKQTLQAQGVVVESLNVFLGDGGKQHHASPEENNQAFSGKGNNQINLEGFEEDHRQTGQRTQPMSASGHINYLI